MKSSGFAFAAAVASMVSTMGVIAPSGAEAAVVVNIQEVGGNVVATTGGTLNLKGLEETGVGGVLAGFNPGFGVFSAAAGQVMNFTGLTGPTSFGASSPVFLWADTYTGTPFRVVGATGVMSVSSVYVSGAPLAAVTTFVGQTFSSLGLTAGVYSYAVPSDTITLNIGGMPAAVPEPATWAMMLFGLGAAGYSLRRRRVGYKALRAF